eukprot:707325-Pleurochrysis_carterae.AAC.5
MAAAMRARGVRAHAQLASRDAGGGGTDGWRIYPGENTKRRRGRRGAAHVQGDEIVRLESGGRVGGPRRATTGDGSGLCPLAPSAASVG